MYGVIQNKAARGYILEVAKISYPQPLGSDIIDACLKDAGMHLSPMQIEGHIQYLEDRGYVCTSKSTLPITNTPIILVTLTAGGIDVLEKTISDPGVTIK